MRLKGEGREKDLQAQEMNEGEGKRRDKTRDESGNKGEGKGREKRTSISSVAR